MTLDTFVESHRPEMRNRLALLNINVEGFEPFVLAGGQNVLGSTELRPKVRALLCCLLCCVGFSL